MNKQPNTLRVATKYGVHEAQGWFAILALIVIIIIPVAVVAAYGTHEVVALLR